MESTRIIDAARAWQLAPVVHAGRTPSYAFTVPNRDHEAVRALKRKAKRLNDRLDLGEVVRDAWGAPVVRPGRFTVRCKGRLGKGNENAREYRRGGRLDYRSVKAEHAQTFDVYLQVERDWS